MGVCSEGLKLGIDNIYVLILRQGNSCIKNEDLDVSGDMGNTKSLW